MTRACWKFDRAWLCCPWARYTSPMLLRVEPSPAVITRKLGVNFYHYIQDRISESNQIPQLSSIIEARAKELNLGASWEAA